MKIQDFALKKQKGQKISMLTCYDYTFARIAADSEVDVLLVGDSLSMVMHGFSTTLNATVNLMALHTAAVARGAANKFIVGDMPFLSFRKDLNSNMTAIGKIMRAGANAVKLEGAKGNLDLVRHAVDSGVPVMGHLGLTPQSVNQLGGFKVQGKEKRDHDEIYQGALALEKAGCFSLVLECVPAGLAREISQDLKIPTIGIGAGVGCDGQVLVLQDMLGMNKDFHPKFLRTYFKGFEDLKSAFNQYHRDEDT
jgi:3-methyl-2-oxobutanoate hydroxymethyltransferase